MSLDEQSAVKPWIARALREYSAAAYLQGSDLGHQFSRQIALHQVMCIELILKAICIFHSSPSCDRTPDEIAREARTLESGHRIDKLYDRAAEYASQGVPSLTDSERSILQVMGRAFSEARYPSACSITTSPERALTEGIWQDPFGSEEFSPIATRIMASALRQLARESASVRELLARYNKDDEEQLVWPVLPRSQN